VLLTIDMTMTMPPSSQETPRAPTSKSRSRHDVSTLHVKSNKQMKKVIERVIRVACALMDHLGKLILSVKLADRWILHFSSLMVSLFALEHSTYSSSLQRSSLLVLRSIFIRHSVHRSLVLEETLAVMIKLPTSKRNLRTVKLSHSNQSVQMISTLGVSLTQSCAADDTQGAAHLIPRRASTKRDITTFVLLR
jgi:cohesin loading factor subunit SCC2